MQEVKKISKDENTITVMDNGVERKLKFVEYINEEKRCCDNCWLKGDDTDCSMVPCSSFLSLNLPTRRDKRDGYFINMEGE